MELYIAKTLSGHILGVYTTMRAARAHLEDLSLLYGRPHEWRDDHLYVDGRYAGRVEVRALMDAYVPLMAR